MAQDQPSPGDQVGFVAIGRNEGERLRRCLLSLKQQSDRIVYVDSGSDDDSVAFAHGAGAIVVNLSTDEPFTAARARNAGFKALQARWPQTQYVVFIDGDCELAEAFPSAALSAFDGNDDIGVVTGRCRELRPDATIYNRLCEMEWNGPVGDIEACGGIFMARTHVFTEAGGFNPSVIAAEDDEFSLRVRARGFRIVRIDTDMYFHDADMHCFGQWWRRAVRAGYAYAQVGEMHPGYFAAPRRRAWAWGLALPAAIVLLAPFTSGWSIMLLGLYLVSFWRTRRRLIAEGAEPPHAGLFAGFLTLSKFPNLIGILDYKRKRLLGRDIAIVEYK
ncbi:MAG: glycosyltransferase family 2 protein [Hyphococcus sp.]